MPLSPGTKLGVYEVTAKIGAGGMGEVYRAHDTSLDRDVAIKVLPDAFATDPERLARFEREAKVLASLNHPNIAAIYGLEKSGDTPALVLELVEGPTLAEMLSPSPSPGLRPSSPPEGERGKGKPLPLEEALPIARQIAEALEAAHEQGIIHRDLKPANVKVKSDGTVKVLDFGLAKALGPDLSDVEAANSPTMTMTAAATKMGVIMGTAAYMSPEQAKGRQVDKRADIWAFGVVLYEMLTGRQAFGGTDISETLAFVLTRQIEWTALPTETPASVRRLLRRCVERERKNRLADMSMARLEIDEADAAPEAPEAPATASSSGRDRLTWAAVGLALGALVIGGAWAISRPASDPPRVATRFQIDLPSALPGAGSLTVSPDGEMIVYGVQPEDSQGGVELHLRRIDSFETAILPGTVGARAQFFSPDSQWIAFFVGDELRKISIVGGAAITVADATGPVGARTGAWGPDGTIVFTVTTGSGFLRVSADGGTPEPLTTLDADGGETNQSFPVFLPDGRALLFSSNAATGTNVDVISLESGARRTLIPGGGRARYIDTGHLVYSYGGSLMAMAFDPTTLEVSGAPIPILDGVRTNDAGPFLSVTPSGAMAYVPGTASGTALQLVWVDRSGRTTPVVEERGDYSYPRISPDGEKLALELDAGNTFDTWIYDIGRGTRIRLTSEGDSSFPAWTPDGTSVAFATRPQGTGAGAFDLAWAPADGSRPPEVLLEQAGLQLPMAWTPDGQTLSYSTFSADGVAIGALPLDGEPTIILALSGSPGNHDISPGGDWLAYESNETGGYEIYLQPYPDLGAKRAISTGGGRHPVWSADGRELFYRHGDEMMVVDVQYEPTLTTSVPRVLFRGAFEFGNASGLNYDVSPDSQRFVMIQADDDTEGGAPEIRVVLNWVDELRRRFEAQ